MTTTYKIRRFVFSDKGIDIDGEFYRNGDVIKTGLTLDEAQEHCQDDATHGEGWFDGYDEED